MKEIAIKLSVAAIFCYSATASFSQTLKPGEILDKQAEEFYNGNYREVIELGKMLLQRSNEKVLFDEQYKVRASWDNMAQSYQYLGMVDSALYYYQKAIDSTEEYYEQYGGLFEYSSEVISRYAYLKYELGLYQEVIELLEPMFEGLSLNYYDSIHREQSLSSIYENDFSLDYYAEEPGYGSERSLDYTYNGKEYFSSRLEYLLLCSIHEYNKKEQKSWYSSIASNAYVDTRCLSLYTRSKLALGELEAAESALRLTLLYFEHLKYASGFAKANAPDMEELIEDIQFNVFEAFLDYRIRRGIPPTDYDLASFSTSLAEEVISRTREKISLQYKPLFDFLANLITYYLQWDEVENASALLNEYLPEYENTDEVYRARLILLDALRLGNDKAFLVKGDYPNLAGPSSSSTDPSDYQYIELFVARFKEYLTLSIAYYERNRYALSFEEQRQYWKTIEQNVQIFYNKVRTGSLMQNPEIHHYLNYSFLNDILEVRAMTKGKSLDNALKLKRAVHETSDIQMRTIYRELLQMKEAYSSALIRNKEPKAYMDSLSSRIREAELNLMNALDPIDLVDSFDVSVIQEQLGEEDAFVEIIKLDGINTEKNLGHFTYQQMPGGELKAVNTPYGYQTEQVNQYLVLIVRSENVYFNLLDAEDLEGKHLKTYQNLMKFKLKDTLSYGNFYMPIVKGRNLATRLGRNVPDGKGGTKYEVYTAYFHQNPLRDCKNIYYSPDGVYNLINPLSLYDPEENAYLSEKYNFKLVSSPRYFIEKEDSTQLTDREVVLFGNPTYDSLLVDKKSVLSEDERAIMDFFNGEIAPLPGTKKEIEAIAQLLGPHFEVRTFSEDHASEKNLRGVTRPAILHIATHGYFLENQAKSSLEQMSASGLLFSGVLQGDDQLSDGIFTSQEAAGLDLTGTALVVLSACQSGLGNVQNGEGVYGLQRGLTLAGAQNILVSLWPISDEATAYWMTRFYNNVAQGSSIEESFSLTLTDVKRQYPHPYYWGAFVLLSNN